MGRVRTYSGIHVLFLVWRRRIDSSSAARGRIGDNGIAAIPDPAFVPSARAWLTGQKVGTIPEMKVENLFETPRLIARRLTSTDAAAMVSIFGDEETMRFVGDSK